MPASPVTYTPLPFVRDDSVGALLRLRGQHAAEAERQRGDLLASMFARLGEQISGSIQSYAKDKQEAPIRAQEAQIRDLNIGNAKAEQAAQATTLATNKTVDDLMKGALITDPTTGATTYDRAKLQQGFTAAGIGHAWPQYSELIDKSDASLKTLKESHRAAIGDVAKLVDAAGNDATVFTNELMRGVKNGLFTQTEAAPYLEAVQRDPAHVAKITASILGKKTDLIERDPTKDLVDPITNEVIKPGTPKQPNSQEAQFLLDGKPVKGDYLPGVDGKPGRYFQNWQDVTARAQVIPPASATSNTSALDDVKESVAGMIDGTIPPALPGRATKEYLATLAEAHRRGYNLQEAVTDWNATQKHIATMNGAQQLRLTQSINQLPELLDSVDALASKWKGGRFPILNKVNLAAAKNGVYGEDVASVARQLDAQIADVTADLGNVYMGGNSPTDHALSLAGKSLSGDWSQKVLHDMVALARGNVKIRLNSINATGVAGVGANNVYAPVVPAATPPPDTGRGGSTPTYQDYLSSRGAKK